MPDVPDQFDGFYFNPNPKTWAMMLEKCYVFRPRRRSKKRGSIPDFYQVWIGTRDEALMLGTIYRRQSGWNAELFHADENGMPKSEFRRIWRTPAVAKAWELERCVRLGEFKTRKLAADAIKEASIDRGILHLWKLQCLDVVTLLGGVK